MRKNLKKLFSYYKPYMGIFVADMFFAFGAAAVSLVIPLVVRYITSEVVYWGSSQALHTIVQLGVFMLVLIAAQCYCNYLRACHGSQDRIRYACGDLFSLPEAVFPVLR